MNATARRPRVPTWLPLTVALVIVAGAGLATTTYVSLEDATAAASEGAFDPDAYADEHFDSEVVPQIEDEAVDLATLLGDLADGADESDFGHAPGEGSAYSFPVTFTGVAGVQQGSILPVTVEGVPEDVTVQLQVGPAINGTALRDVTGTVSFNDFVNQLEFQNVATAFNERVRDGLLAETTLPTEGQTVTVTGAFTRVNPALVSVVPVALEVG